MGMYEGYVVKYPSLPLCFVQSLSIQDFAVRLIFKVFILNGLKFKVLILDTLRVNDEVSGDPVGL
jgi:hypothetical protein